MISRTAHQGKYATRRGADQPGTLAEQLARARGEAPPPPPKPKSLRQVRADLILAYMADTGMFYLPGAYFSLRMKGLTGKQVDTAVDDLLGAGLIVAEVAQYGQGICLRRSGA